MFYIVCFYINSNFIDYLYKPYWHLQFCMVTEISCTFLFCNGYGVLVNYGCHGKYSVVRKGLSRCLFCPVTLLSHMTKSFQS